MALSPLTCTGCGAPLVDEVDDPVLRCAYCGQNHRVTRASGAGEPAAPSPVPAPSAQRPAAIVVALVVVLAAGGAMLAFRGAGASPQAAVQTGSDAPGDATSRYVEGQAVDVYWGTSWWAGTIKRVQGEGSYRIGYDGWASSWDEDVTPRRLRRREAPSTARPPPTPTAPVASPEVKSDPNASYRVGEAVDIHWGSRWWPGRVVEVKERRYHVTYDGWASSHDETVEASRLRRR